MEKLRYSYAERKVVPRAEGLSARAEVRLAISQMRPMPSQASFPICVDCGEAFVFTEEARSYFALRGFTEPPRRCRYCYTVFKHKTSRLLHDVMATDIRSTTDETPTPVRSSTRKKEVT